MLSKSLETDAGTLILDLEDAVPPQKKVEARAVLCEWLESVAFGTKDPAIRINDLSTPWCFADIQHTVEAGARTLMVPKVEQVSDLLQVSQVLDRVERRAGLEPGSVELIPVASETPKALVNCDQIGGASRVHSMTWGAEDLATSMHATANRDTFGNYQSVFADAQDRVLLSCRTHNLLAIDSVFVNFRDLEGLKSECQRSAALGFDGKLTIHPDQIPIVMESFAPTHEDIDRAKRLIDAFADAQASGRLAFQFEGQMVDAPHLEAAKALLERSTIQTA